MVQSAWKTLFLIAMVLLVGGCDAADDDVVADDDTGDDDTADDDDATDDDDTAPCSVLDPPTGSIEIRQSLAGSTVYLDIRGEMAEATALSLYETVAEEDGCRYLLYEPNACDPPCSPPEFCTAQGECKAFPAGISGGPLTVTGLGDPVILEPEEYGPGTYREVVQLDVNAIGAGDSIHAELTGDVYPALSLGAKFVDKMVPHPTTDEPWIVPYGQDAVITWEQGPDADACVELYIYSDNLYHGLPIHDIIHCIGPDSGSLVVPQAVIDAFPPWTSDNICVGHDCPPPELRRFTRDTVQTDAGRGELVVYSSGSFYWDHGDF